MGYSGRYHAASLAAVFIALAIGILIGIGLADDVVSSATEELRSSLRSDLNAAEDHADELQSQLDRNRRFSDQVLPAVIADRLAGRRVALIEFGDVSDDLAADARAAVVGAGGDLSSIARIAEPPDLDALIEHLPPRFASIKPRSRAARCTRQGDRQGPRSATRRSSRTSSRSCSRPSPATCGASIASSSPPTTTAISRRTSARRRPTFEGGIVAGDRRAGPSRPSGRS